MAPHLVTAQPFQSDSEKCEPLGGATNRLSLPRTRPFALLTDIVIGCVPPEPWSLSTPAGGKMSHRRLTEEDVGAFGNDMSLILHIWRLWPKHETRLYTFRCLPFADVICK